MLLGRLEVFSLLVLFTPQFWRNSGQIPLLGGADQSPRRALITGREASARPSGSGRVARGSAQDAVFDERCAMADNSPSRRRAGLGSAQLHPDSPRPSGPSPSPRARSSDG